MLNDIYLELDGDQHFRPIGYFGGDESLESQKIKDNIKNQYALDNNLTLIRIYADDVTPDNIKNIFEFSSTTIENLQSVFKNILVIKDGKVILKTGLYNK